MDKTKDLEIFLAQRLFLSPREIEKAFAVAPAFTGEVVVVFSKGRSGVGLNANLLPRQSFLWSGITRRISTFQSTDEIRQALQVFSKPRERELPFDHLNRGIAEEAAVFKLLPDAIPNGAVSVFVSKTVSNLAEMETFLQALLPHLELYRTSTLHTFNDSYQLRVNELETLLPLMSASVSKTAFSIISSLAEGRRFGHPEYAILQFINRKWIATEATIASANDLAELILGDKVDLEVAQSGKVLGKLLDGCQILLVPFTRQVDAVEFTYDAVTQQYKYQANGARNKAGGRIFHDSDVIVLLRYRDAPAPSAINSLLFYRHYYFEVFLPGLLAHLRRVIYARARSLPRDTDRSKLRLASTATPWEETAALCKNVLPTVCSIFDIDVDVRIYDVGLHELRSIYAWQSNGRQPNAEQMMRPVSLRRGNRDSVAATFRDSNPAPYRIGRPKAVPVDDDDHALVRLRESSLCYKLRFKDITIGTIEFVSQRSPDFFSRSTESLIEDFVHAIESFIQQFLALQDGDWLATEAAAYDNLHELQGRARVSDRPISAQELRGVIKSFDAVSIGPAGTLGDLQKFLDELYIEATCALLEIQDPSRIRFNCTEQESLANLPVSGTRLEMFKRIVKNLFNNFHIDGPPEEFEYLSVRAQAKPFPALRVRQETAKPFPEDWLRVVGFRPLSIPGRDERLHHGLFLCGAMARYLGGYAWMGNQPNIELGPRSVIEILIPLQDKAQ